MRGSVQGLVVRPDGVTPIAGATITLIRGPGVLPRTAVRADDAGAFSISGLAEGEWLVSAASEGKSSTLASVRVFEDAVSELTIEIAQGGSVLEGGSTPSMGDATGSVRGRVFRAASGKPAGNASITVVRGAGPAPDIAPVTNSSGTFVLDGLPEGKWTLRATGPRGEVGEVTVLVKAGSTASARIEI